MNLELFNFENNQVRIIMIDNEPWFVGKDIATVLGYVNTNDAINTHVDEEDRMLAEVPSESLGQSGTNSMTVINESGLYSLILRSKLDSAKNFKKWVTKEVLPSIRKTGQYGFDNLSPIERLQIVVNLGVEHERKLKEQEKKLQEQKVLVETIKTEFDSIKQIAAEAVAELTTIPRSTEEPLKISERDLIRQLVNAYCRSKGVKQKDIWNILYSKLAYATHVDVKSRARHSKKSALEETDRAGLISELYKIASRELN